MITNKDIRVENGSLILNGDPYPLDGQSPEAIMQIVKDNSDSTPTANSNNPVKSGGVFTAITGEIIAEDKNISITGNGTDSYVASDYDLSKSGYKCVGISSCSLSNINYVLLSSVITPGSTDSKTRMLFGTRNAAAWPSDFTASFNLTLLYKKVNS